MSKEKQTLSYSIVQEGEWFVAQCLEIDVATQGKNPEEAADNLREAIKLHFEEPLATTTPQIGQIEVEIHAA
jgi:predicted RNase H-like HicB family nuclease